MKETLRDLRIASGKSVAEAAEQIGVTRQALSNYENGIRQINITQTLKLAELYDSTAEDVIKAQLNSLRR